MIQKSFQKANSKANKKSKSLGFLQLFVKTLIFSIGVKDFCGDMILVMQKSYFLRKQYVMPQKSFCKRMDVLREKPTLCGKNMWQA